MTDPEIARIAEGLTKRHFIMPGVASVWWPSQVRQYLTGQTNAKRESKK
jgi:hypothetical protein